MQTRALTLFALLIAGASAPDTVLAPASARPTGPGIAGLALQDAEFDKAKASVEAELATALAELAAWCQSNKAYLMRDQLYESLITLVPDHADARKFLGYTYDKKAGEWVRRREYREPKNANPAAALEALDKRTALLKDHTTRMIGLLERYIDTLGAAKRQAELDVLLANDPTDERVRKLLGHVKVTEGEEEVWLSAEAAKAKERRDTLRTTLRDLKDGPPPITPAELEEPETTWGIEWKSNVATPRLRVLSNAGEAEARRVLLTSHLLWDFLPVVMGGELTLPPELTVYLVNGGSAKSAFLGKYPDLSDLDRKEYPSLISGWLGKRARLACWAESEEARLDSACKQMTSLYLWHGFGIKGEHGWLLEGVGLYVNHKVVGTRLSYQVSRTEYENAGDKELDQRIRDADANWLTLTRRILERAEGKSKLPFLLGKNTNQLTAEDMLIAFSLSAYLIEGYGPEKLNSILKRAGVGGEASLTVLESELGATLPVIQARLLEWLQAVKG